MKIRILFGLLLWGSYLPGWASHIAGGNIEMVALDKPGQFQLSLNLYIDDASKGPDATIDPTITLSIFRKSDDKLMGNYPIKLGRRLILVYANPACAPAAGAANLRSAVLGGSAIRPSCVQRSGGVLCGLGEMLPQSERG